MRKNPSAQSFKKRMRELEKVSTSIEAKMTKLEKIITDMSKSLS